MYHCTVAILRQETRGSLKTWQCGVLSSWDFFSVKKIHWVVQVMCYPWRLETRQSDTVANLSTESPWLLDGLKDVGKCMSCWAWDRKRAGWFWRVVDPRIFHWFNWEESFCNSQYLGIRDGFAATANAWNWMEVIIFWDVDKQITLLTTICSSRLCIKITMRSWMTWMARGQNKEHTFCVIESDLWLDMFPGNNSSTAGRALRQ